MRQGPARLSGPLFSRTARLCRPLALQRRALRSRSASSSRRRSKPSLRQSGVGAFSTEARSSNRCSAPALQTPLPLRKPSDPGRGRASSGRSRPRRHPLSCARRRAPSSLPPRLASSSPTAPQRCPPRPRSCVSPRAVPPRPRSPCGPPPPGRAHRAASTPPRTRTRLRTSSACRPRRARPSRPSTTRSTRTRSTPSTRRTWCVVVLSRARASASKYSSRMGERGPARAAARAVGLAGAVERGWSGKHAVRSRRRRTRADLLLLAPPGRNALPPPSLALHPSFDSRSPHSITCSVRFGRRCAGGLSSTSRPSTRAPGSRSRSAPPLASAVSFRASANSFRPTTRCDGRAAER